MSLGRCVGLLHNIRIKPVCRIKGPLDCRYDDVINQDKAHAVFNARRYGCAGVAVFNLNNDDIFCAVEIKDFGRFATLNPVTENEIIGNLATCGNVNLPIISVSSPSPPSRVSTSRLASDPVRDQLANVG